MVHQLLSPPSGYSLSPINLIFHSNQLIIHWIYDLCVTSTRSKRTRFRCHWDVIRLLQTRYNEGKLRHTIEEVLRPAMKTCIDEHHPAPAGSFFYFQIEWHNQCFRFRRVMEKAHVPSSKASPVDWYGRPIRMESKSFSVSVTRLHTAVCADPFLGDQLTRSALFVTHLSSIIHILKKLVFTLSMKRWPSRVWSRLVGCDDLTNIFF